MPSTFDVSGLVDAIGDGVVISDREGLIVVWNPAAERIFGFSEAEALGQSLDLITPDRHRRRHWDGYHKSMSTGTTKYGADVLRVPALHKDGHQLSIAFTVGMLHGADGEVSGIAAIIRDETVRWEEERRLKRRVSDLEAELSATPA
ncbi:PAS domain-containing protein [Methylobacterium gnaphalii]|uniref:Transcriptional regulator n=1 Tax=Methylobacterium gnaphalii TaxID=1010610 RepID=A0A512JRM4_9HYPH|nr:PAS domain-containing protein [Methylobacterium gnaphalii]GEP12618.1 transcriptional regulator [Methylobacterium gnaphalii]GJD71311.1 Sensor protein FixL [Methylobacterium gnaphalii]GLS48032.1 transcriptional regulator [Methylobacterium gnaphalii]